MPIADLLGVQFDMQLLLKLSVSAAVVLFVSLAYRFYTSRDPAKPQQLLVEGNAQPPSTTFRNCKTELPSRCDSEKTPKATVSPELTPSWNAAGKDSVDRDSTVKDGHTAPQKQEEVASAEVSTEPNVSRVPAAQAANSTRSRSPCFLQKLESSVGVGRELRQDLDHQGTHSTFLSKAEIKVVDANLVLDGKGDQVLPGKIYNYYIRSSSHSSSDSKAVLGQSGELRKRKCGEDPDTPQVLNHKDEPRSPVRRKQSYLFATEETELPAYVQLDLVTDSNVPIKTANLEVLDVEEHTPSAPESEALNLNLGNCLESLLIAKRNGQTTTQQAALGVLSDNYLQVLKEPNLFGRLLSSERELIREQRMRGRQYLMVADMDPRDCSAGGQQAALRKRMSSAVYYYDDNKNVWQTLCLIPPEVVSRACAMCTMDNYLFVALGCEGADSEKTPSKRVFCYNPLTSIWKEISPMNEARPRCKLAALEGFVYAIGGECLSSVERYDPRADRWTFVAPLPYDTFAVAHHVAVCSGEIFVSGGSLRYMLLRYSPATNTWRHTLLGSKDRTADLEAEGRFLYRFDVNPQLGISVYRYHTVAKLWYECSSRRLLRCPTFQCTTMDGTIYCISRQFTMRFLADEISPAFIDEDLSVLSEGKGMLFPFVLSLPDKKLRQTSV
ncbi:kelch domain-containing protein 7A [Synchiropus splendidus]|uniref:kelch domain-containing protein 7A n=1 Tax=Synchiropus splendidus TaxID=270530 RepID=UPI00237EB10F|nr:kelch domain-containing protein 7A [Synchiropus splendidus]